MALLIVAGVAAAMVLSQHLTAAEHPGEVDPQEVSDLAALAKVGPIDTHAHVFQDVPAYYRFMK